MVTLMKTEKRFKASQEFSAEFPWKCAVSNLTVSTRIHAGSASGFAMTIFTLEHRGVGFSLKLPVVKK